MLSTDLKMQIMFDWEAGIHKMGKAFIPAPYIKDIVKKFEVVHEEKSESFNLGYIVTLIHDDGTDCPHFTTQDGTQDSYEDWYCLRPYYG